MKKGEVETKLIVSMVIIVLVAIALISIVKVVLKQTKASDVAVCQQNAILNAQTRIPGLGWKELVKFTCPVTKSQIGIDDIKTVNAIDKKEFTEFGYTDPIKYNLDKKIWQQINDCYAKLNYGKSPMFDRDFSTIFESEPVYCVVCATIEFDGNISAQFGSKDMSAAIYNSKKKVFSSQMTLQQTVNQDNDQTASMIDTHYKPNGKQVVLYSRMNAAIIGRKLNEWYEYIRASDNPTTVSDFETVQVLPYNDPNILANKCNILANSFED